MSPANSLAYRQVARALQGKTACRSPDTIMSDEHHHTNEYIAFLDNNASNADRPRDIYWGLAMIPLFAYGHHTKAIQLGMQMMETMPRLWSARVSYVVYFYLALSLLTLHNEYPARGYLDGSLHTVLKYKAEVDFARSACDANYGMWSLILEALICEVRNDHTSAIQSFEVSCRTARDGLKEKLIRPGCNRSLSNSRVALGRSACSRTAWYVHRRPKSQYFLGEGLPPRLGPN